MLVVRRALAWPALLCGAALLAGCASGPSAPPPSPRQQQASAVAQQALGRYQLRDYAGALALFEQALALEQSMENEAGIARDTLNLALCLQMLGRDDDAGQRLGALLHASLLPVPAAERAEAGLQLALLALRRGQPDAAAASLTQAGADCGGNCGAAGKLLALTARLALERGDAARAATAADAALAWQRSHGGNDVIEQANALRLLAAAKLGLGPAPMVQAAQLTQLTHVRALLEQALALDRQAGASDKIYQDLLMLGQAADAPERRRQYWQRARQVAQAAGLAAERLQVERLLAPPPD